MDVKSIMFFYKMYCLLISMSSRIKGGLLISIIMRHRLICIVFFSDGWTGCCMYTDITVYKFTRHRNNVFPNKTTTVTHQRFCSLLPFQIHSKLSMLKSYWCGCNVPTVQKSTKIFSSLCVMDSAVGIFVMKQAEKIEQLYHNRTQCKWMCFRC